MFFYNQNDYPKHQYNMPNGTKATIKSGGCGLCSTLNACNNMAGKELYTITAIRNLAQSCSARYNGGTDILKLWKAIIKEHKEFSIGTTSDKDKLLAHLKKGGYAILNQGSSYDVFSSQGHFVCAYGVDGNDIKVMDSAYTTTRYNKEPRCKRIIKKTNNGCIVSLNEAAKACKDRSPSFYLISYAKPEYKKWTGTVKVKTNLNVRSTPESSTDKNIVCKFKNGTKVTVIGESGKFYKITYQNKTRYVAKEYVVK